MKIPLFDLDGTLLQDGRGGKIMSDAYDFAIKTVFHLPHVSMIQSGILIEGSVHNEIFMRFAKKYGFSEKDALTKLPLITKAVDDYFLAHVHEKPSQAHIGAKELLKLLMNRQVRCGTLTGNTEVTGWEKLMQAGLKEYISFGAFGNMAMKRVELIPIAKQKYEETFGETRPITDFVIIGDTPRDILCAKDGGISVIAVATGNFTKEELMQENPNIAIDSLEEQEKILSFLL